MPPQLWEIRAWLRAFANRTQHEQDDNGPDDGDDDRSDDAATRSQIENFIDEPTTQDRPKNPDYKRPDRASGRPAWNDQAGDAAGHKSNDDPYDDVYHVQPLRFRTAKSRGPGGQYAHILSLIHISEPTRRTPSSYAVFCLKK